MNDETAAVMPAEPGQPGEPCSGPNIAGMLLHERRRSGRRPASSPPAMAEPCRRRCCSCWRRRRSSPCRTADARDPRLDRLERTRGQVEDAGDRTDLQCCSAMIYLGCCSGSRPPLGCGPCVPRRAPARRSSVRGRPEAPISRSRRGRNTGQRPRWDRLSEKTEHLSHARHPIVERERARRAEGDVAQAGDHLGDGRRLGLDGGAALM